LTHDVLIYFSSQQDDDEEKKRQKKKEKKRRTRQSQCVLKNSRTYEKEGYSTANKRSTRSVCMKKLKKRKQ